MLKTVEGYDINDIIQPGLDNPAHPVGVLACSKSSYFTFDEILVCIAQIHHKRNLRSIEYQKENYENVKFMINDLKIILNENLLEVQITSIRNIDGFSFSSKISRFERREISKKILEFILKSENSLLGKHGKFAQFESYTNQGLQSKDQDTYNRSCGFYRDWPDGRVIYFSKDDLVSLITNEEDHLKISFKSYENFDCEKLIHFFDVLKKFEEKFDFSFDKNLGYLTSSPTNLGKIQFKKNIYSRIWNLFSCYNQSFRR